MKRKEKKKGEDINRIYTDFNIYNFDIKDKELKINGEVVKIIPIYIHKEDIERDEEVIEDIRGEIKVIRTKEILLKYFSLLLNKQYFIYITLIKIKKK